MKYMIFNFVLESVFKISLEMRDEFIFMNSWPKKFVFEIFIYFFQLKIDMFTLKCMIFCKKMIQSPTVYDNIKFSTII